MNPRRIVPVLALALLSGARAFAASPAYSYVTTGPGKQILKVDNTTHAVVSIYTATAAGVATLSDVTLFADGKLYAGAINGSDPSTSNIVKVDPATSAFALYTNANNPRELRFSAYGMLFCNGGGGVRRVASEAGGCLNSVNNAAGTAGSGLAFSANGSLIAIVDGKLIKVTLGADGQTTGSTQIATGLSTVKSLGVVAGGENTATGFSPDDVLVATASEIRRFIRDKAQATGYQAASVPVVSAPAGRTINFAEVDAEDRVWFTTMMVNGPSNDPNGELWVYDGVSAALVAAAPKQNGKYWPLVGLAIDPSDRTVAISAAHPRADFGSSWFEIAGTINPACTVTVHATSKLGDLPAFASTYTLSPYLGDEGFATVYDASVSPLNCDVFPVNDGRVVISARQASEASPRILKCETNPGCAPVPLLGAFHTGPLDDDASDEGGTDSFSKWLVVNESLPAAGYTFCGIAAPLKSGGDADHPPTTTNTGSNLTVKFQIGGSSCGPSQSLTNANAQFLISVARVRPDYEAKHLPDASGNSNQPPLFRYSSTGRAYIYNLSLKNLDGTNFEPGTYEITITDLNSPPYISTPPSIYFSVTTSGNK